MRGRDRAAVVRKLHKITPSFTGWALKRRSNWTPFFINSDIDSNIDRKLAQMVYL